MDEVEFRRERAHQASLFAVGVVWTAAGSEDEEIHVMVVVLE